MRLLLVLFLIVFNFCAYSQSYSTAKPWTYWWWMGSAVTKPDITKQMEEFRRAGLGGVHIIPIYGVKGMEAHYISFLSDEWMNVMQYTIDEGERLGLGVDLTTGTGWPFGGPNVQPELGAKQMKVLSGTEKVEFTRQAVKRAAPGGEGLVLDPFHKTAMSEYLTRFDTAFLKTSKLPRSMYMDSYEAYGANWTDDFLEEFRTRRGYELENRWGLFVDSSGKKEAVLVKIDYHQTLAELLRERYAEKWTSWSTRKGFLTRYQAHGSPGNLLDLYDEADIPETESFGTSRFAIPGLRVDPDYSIDQFGTPNPLAMKFASSPAHFSGKKLVSSETGTWLANHFKVSLSQIKPQIDELFVAGINHVFYHGTTYSPPSEPYPGWLFYASTHFGPTSHFAEHLSLLNKYVERCQEILQGSKPDNDVLVYFPIHDLWSTVPKSAGGVHLLEVHHVDRWLLDLPFGKLSEKLWNEGYSFDYVSDRQLERLKVEPDGDVSSGFSSYKVILIPSTIYIPEHVVDKLLALAKGGARIVFHEKMPDWVTGYASNEKRQKELSGKLAALKARSSVEVSKDLESTLLANKVRKESLPDHGLAYVRKRDADGTFVYFVANLGGKFNEGWVQIEKGGVFDKFDPLQDTRSLLPDRIVDGRTEIYLKLLPGESCFLRKSKSTTRPELIFESKKEYEIKGQWNVRFKKGLPGVPKPLQINDLKSWTTFSEEAENFSGTALYTMQFDLTEPLEGAKEIYLDLGDVREVANVRINGTNVGIAWAIPFRVALPEGLLKQQNNDVEIEVTNLSANYMRLRDTQAPDWKKFYDINIVDITYKKFDASKWEPMPSGLLGPVKLVYR